MEIILDNPGWPSVITRVLISEKRRQKSERFEDAALLTLKVEERARANDFRWPLEATKGKEMYSPQEPPEEHSPADTLILAQ